MFKNEIKFYKVPYKNRNMFTIVNNKGANILEIDFLEKDKYPLHIWQAPAYNFGTISEQYGMKLHEAVNKVIIKYYKEDTEIKTLDKYFDFLNEFMLELNNFNLKEMQVEVQYSSHLDLYKLYRTSPEKYKVMKDLENALGV
jgi:hypothetical protein